MKLAYSNVAAPGWDLAMLVARAKEYGYQGVELRGLEGQMHLPLAPQIAGNPQKIGKLLRETGVELVCLATGCAFHMREAKEIARQQEIARENIDLASKLECPYVRVFGAEVPKARFLGYERREEVLARIAAALRGLADYAAQRRVTVLVENSGDFVDSQAMWYLVDAANSPAVKCCWNPTAALTRGEKSSVAIPRLGARIGLVHVNDAQFKDGHFESHALPGQGTTDVRKTVQLLKGIGYRGYLVFDWPRMWNTALADGEKALPAAAKYFQGLLDEKPVPLSAYKGDKNAPRQGYEFIKS